ncbi:CAP domain-containing protein [Arthrobacter sp. Leaf69]|uniref:CAP domain-containing protein n=1 Tax=Arthrobacter sp. Leaf69 TaxID=1736232 RepID=UPI0006FEF2E1|nr:CAP domain-containing protein [Arthrobacter sp. Leaf69]
MKISKALGASLLTAALVAGPICGASSAPAAVPVATQSTSTDSLGLFQESNRQVLIDTFDRINAFRATKGLKPLKFNVNIATVSQKWSDEMAATGLFAHNGDYVTGAPEGWTSASENIAWYTYAPSGQRFVNLWINSPGHNANMSRPDDQYMGIGISSVDGRIYATANHFRYQDGVVPPGSYNSPRDFFNGLPELGAGSVVIVNAPEPAWDTAKRTYTIPNASGVEYRLYSGDDQSVKAPGTYPAVTGYNAIVATAKPGYRLSNTVSYWSRTFESAPVTPRAPVFDKTARTVTIPSTTGVQYLLNGVAVPAGVHSFHDTAKVEARAFSGHTLTGLSSWSVTVPLVNITVQAAPTANKAAGTYTIPARPGVEFLIDYKPVPAGTYKSSVDVTVSARATNGYTLTGTSQWVLHPGLETVSAAGPLFVDYSNLFLIPDRQGVQYFLNGKAVAPGRYTGTGKVVVTAAAKPGFRLEAGATSWSYDYTQPAIKVTPAVPAFNRDRATYTVPARTGVRYFVNGAAKAAGTYPSSTKVIITAQAATGYILTGTASWTYDLAPLAVTAAAPTSNLAAGTYTIPKRTGVTYLVDGKAVAAGTFKGNSRRVAVTAKAAPGYRLAGTSSWTLDFRRAVTPVKPAMNAATNRYTIPKQPGVAYYVDGKLTAAGTFAVANGRTVKFTAKASVSTYRLAGTSVWSFRF